ncbi:vWA domain-containing protein [Intestinibacter sp.]
MTIEESISKLKINLIRRRPFYGVILMKLGELKESDTTDIASTDGSTIFYNREYMEKLTESERNFYLLHQLYHCIFMHPTRMVNKDSKVANVAADYLVNYYIDMEKEEFRRNQIMISPPKDALMAESDKDKALLEKLSFEQLYEMLYKQNKKQKDDINMDDSSENNGQGSSGLGQNIDYKNVKEDLIRPKNVQKTSSNMRRIIQESIITNKMQGNKSMGDMPGNLFRRIEELIGSRLPWHKYLRRYLSNIASDDLSFDTPDKNHIYRDLILPGIYEDENRLEDILFVIDTSGSISDDDLNNFMTQAYNICNDFNATGKVIFFDSIVQGVFDIDKDNFKKARPAGGEGTNVNSALSYIRDEKLEYICAVVLTDGYFPKPNVLIRNVIWCLTEDATTSNIEGYKGSKIIKM